MRTGREEDVRLEGAPVPSTTDTLCDRADRLLTGVAISILAWYTDGLSRGSLVAAFAGDAVVAGVAALTPGAVVGVAEITRSLEGTLGVEASLLVERDSVWSVATAEDVSTTAAVMTTCEECERRRAGWGSAEFSACISL